MLILVSQAVRYGQPATYSATYWSSSCDKEVAFVMLLNIYAERAAGTFIFHPECEGKNEDRAYGRYVRAVRSTP